MKNFRRSLVLAAVSLSALVSAQGGAQAGAFGIREQSATAQGLSFAGAAAGSGGLSSMFWNPATVTMRPGWQSELHTSLIFIDADITPLAGTSPLLLPLGPSGNIGQDAIMAAGYTSYQVSDTLWFGLSTSTPFGLVTDPRQNWAGQVYSRSSKILSVNVNPIAAVKINEWLSVAAGPMVQYFDVRLKNALGVTPNAPSLILDGDDVGAGFTAGVNITPFAGTAVGIGFRSSIHHELEGNITTPVAVTPIRANVNTPEQVTLGLSQVITPDLTLHAGFEWTNWSRLKTPAIKGGPTGVVGALHLNYDDGYLYSLGLDYRLTDRFTLRAGVAWEQSPIDTDTRATRVPDADRLWLSVGAGYQWSDQLSFNVAYSYIAPEKGKINIVPGHQDFASVGLPFVAEAEATIQVVSAAIKYRWDAPARPMAPVAAPIVRKY